MNENNEVKQRNKKEVQTVSTFKKKIHSIDIKQKNRGQFQIE